MYIPDKKNVLGFKKGTKITIYSKSKEPKGYWGAKVTFIIIIIIYSTSVIFLLFPFKLFFKGYQNLYKKIVKLYF